MSFAHRWGPPETPPLECRPSRHDARSKCPRKRRHFTRRARIPTYRSPCARAHVRVRSGSPAGSARRRRRCGETGCCSSGRRFRWRNARHAGTGLSGRRTGDPVRGEPGSRGLGRPRGRGSRRRGRPGRRAAGRVAAQAGGTGVGASRRTNPIVEQRCRGPDYSEKLFPDYFAGRQRSFLGIFGLPGGSGQVRSCRRPAPDSGVRGRIPAEEPFTVLLSTGKVLCELLRRVKRVESLEYGVDSFASILACGSSDYRA